MNYDRTPAYIGLDERFAATMRGRIIGRRIRHKLLAVAIDVAPLDYDGEGIEKHYNDRIRAALYAEYGSPMIIMILIPVITELVKLMLIWWLNRSNRQALVEWQHAS